MATIDTSPYSAPVQVLDCSICYHMMAKNQTVKQKLQPRHQTLLTGTTVDKQAVTSFSIKSVNKLLLRHHYVPGTNTAT